MGLYYFARPNAMQGHEFTDDVAIVNAATKRSAIKKFSKFYGSVRPEEVYRIPRKYRKLPFILTSY